MKKLKITVNGKEYEVEVEILEDNDSSSQSMPPNAMYQPMSGYQPAPALQPQQVVAAKPKSKAPAKSEGGLELLSPMNGVVLETLATAGQEVKEGQVVVVLEAMKMKTNVTSSRNGIVSEVKIRANDSVESGQVLLTYAG